MQAKVHEDHELVNDNGVHMRAWRSASYSQCGLILGLSDLNNSCLSCTFEKKLLSTRALSIAEIEHISDKSAEFKICRYWVFGKSNTGK